MKIRNVILALGMLVVGASSMAAGCGGNPCQDLKDAYTKVSSGKGCSSFKTAADAINVDNCPTNVDTTAVDCYTGCIGKLKDCTDVKQLTDYGTCAQKCVK